MSNKFSVANGIALSEDQYYDPIETMPLNVTAIVLTVGNIQSRGILRTEKDRENYKGWFPMPRQRKQ